jgi:hypothetical protein
VKKITFEKYTHQLVIDGMANAVVILFVFIAGIYFFPDLLKVMGFSLNLS